MNGIAVLSPWIAVAVALLLVIGGSIILIGALGLMRLPSFYQRIHGPSITLSLGTACILLASMLYFSAPESRPIIHEIIISAFIFLTAPVVSMLVLRAAIYRDLRAGKSEKESTVIREMLQADSSKE
jgi:multicomponent K+:H+ antiporter subunit G